MLLWQWKCYITVVACALVDLDNMSVLSPRVSSIHIRQILHARVKTITYCILYEQVEGYNSILDAIKYELVVTEP